jgi:hypothetical protein
MRTVPEACAALQIGESRFHALRNEWLQESLELLEPRRAGRPPKSSQTDASARCTQLERLLEVAKHAADRAELRRTIDQVLSLGACDGQRGKKRMTRRAVHPALH